MDFCKINTNEEKMLISSGKLRMEDKCVFSSFNMIYLSPPLFSV